MSLHAEIRLLLEQLGPANPDVSHVTQIADRSWVVGWGEDADILLELDEAASRVVLTMTLGSAREADRERLYEMFLGYNAIWRDTGGVRIAVVEGQAIQVLAMHAQALDLETAPVVLGNFAAKALVWRRLLQAGLSSSAEAPAQAAGIRV
jgi:hypothetical protein